LRLVHCPANDNIVKSQLRNLLFRCIKLLLLLCKAHNWF